MMMRFLRAQFWQMYEINAVYISLERACRLVEFCSTAFQIGEAWIANSNAALF